MKAAVLFSGGKDSCYTLWKGIIDKYDIVSLIIVHSKNPESWMFHYPNVQWAELQAEALGMPCIIIKTLGKKEEELKDLENALMKLKNKMGIEAILSGAIASKYQKQRIDFLCSKLEIKSIAPLWNKDQAEVVKEEIKSGFKIIITAYQALGLNKKWLGREMSLNFLKELIYLNEKFGLNIAGEGGEYETFVIDGPNFKKRIKISNIEITGNDSSGQMIIKNAKLEEKF